MKEKYFVYILRSINNPTKSYIGFTRDIKRRLQEHNDCTQIYTKRYAPWELETCVVFSQMNKALAFEKYLLFLKFTRVPEMCTSGRGH
ncbi:MAG: GIY-YIG nuclease family protein [Candidatus Margulisbacteria bacterium]|nr:GIY-YIG nuclease family protein [Candidatus Margulisiibacteriota bacterium]